MSAIFCALVWLLFCRGLSPDFIHGGIGDGLDAPLLAQLGCGDEVELLFLLAQAGAVSCVEFVFIHGGLLAGGLCPVVTELGLITGLFLAASCVCLAQGGEGAEFVSSFCLIQGGRLVFAFPTGLGLGDGGALSCGLLVVLLFLTHGGWLLFVFYAGGLFFAQLLRTGVVV